MITGYTDKFVERQRYFPINSVLYNLWQCPDARMLSSNDESPEHFQKIHELYPAYRYFAQASYPDDMASDLVDKENFYTLRILDARTGRELVSLTKEEYFKLPMMTYSCSLAQMPSVLVSMSSKGVSLIKDLTETSFWAIRATQTMLKRLWIDPTKDPAKVSDILAMETLTKWLPKDATFDLDRFPSKDSIVLGEQLMGGPIWECFANEHTPLREWVVPKKGRTKYRWVRYADRYAGQDHERRSRAIPLHVIPEDRSILMIPMKKKTDNYVRDYRDDFELFVEIVYCQREDGKVGDTLHDLMQHIDNL